jgi:hypothetical protein
VAGILFLGAKMKNGIQNDVQTYGRVEIVDDEQGLMNSLRYMVLKYEEPNSS